MVEFLEAEGEQPQPTGNQTINTDQGIEIVAQQLEILSHQGAKLAGPLNFTIHPNSVLRWSGKVAQVRAHYLMYC